MEAEAIDERRKQTAVATLCLWRTLSTKIIMHAFKGETGGNKSESKSENEQAIAVGNGKRARDVNES